MNVKSYHTTEELRSLYRTEKNAKLAQRIHGVYLASKGLTCPEIMDITAAARRTVQQWVHKYNKQGIAGLKDKPRPGTPTKLPRDKEIILKKRIETGPTKADRVSALNGPAIRRILKREFGVLYSRQGLYDLLHRLGYSCLCPRPQHENSNPELQADFKKTSSRRWMQSNQSIQVKK
ncbi:MAG: helix-turn-helix domain-containing protein [Desulfobulbaceae bacterium]|nr:helix-turn-helix domain-containing protein [Desulfobulbaceae bacterium]